MVGRSVSSDRSRVSTASASGILSPAPNSTRNSSRARGLGAALTSASTSCDSRYSGSGLVAFADASLRGFGYSGALSKL